MLDWLPEFMDGLFYMLSDENKELKQVRPSLPPSLPPSVLVSSSRFFSPCRVQLAEPVKMTPICPYFS